MDVKEKLLQCFLNIGVVIDDTEDDVDLKEYITDSVQFIAAIVEIERIFSIEFPDELLLFSVFDSFNGLVKIVESILKEGNEV
jgi:phosphopantetheine attachment domain protein